MFAMYKAIVQLNFHYLSCVSKATAAVHRLRPADGDRQPQQDAGTNCSVFPTRTLDLQLVHPTIKLHVLPNARMQVVSHYYATGDPCPTRSRPAEYLLRRCDAKEYHSQRLPDERATVPIRVYTVGDA